MLTRHSLRALTLSSVMICITLFNPHDLTQPWHNAWTAPSLLPHTTPHVLIYPRSFSSIPSWDPADVGGQAIFSSYRYSTAIWLGSTRSTVSPPISQRRGRLAKTAKRTPSICGGRPGSPMDGRSRLVMSSTRLIVRSGRMRQIARSPSRILATSRVADHIEDTAQSRA